MYQWVTVAFCFSIGGTINLKIIYVLIVELHINMVYVHMYVYRYGKNIYKIRNVGTD